MSPEIQKSGITRLTNPIYDHRSGLFKVPLDHSFFFPRWQDVDFAVSQQTPHDPSGPYAGAGNPRSV